MLKYVLVVLLSNTNIHTDDGKVYDSLAECDAAGQEYLERQPTLSYACFPMKHSNRLVRGEEVTL